MSFNDQDNEETPDWCGRFSILLVEAIDHMKSENYFTKDFPEPCPDNNDLPCGCNINRMKKVFFGETGMNYDKILDDSTERGLFILIEFLYNHSAKPTSTRFHSFFAHDDVYDFSIESGKLKFTNEINSIFNKLKAPFQLSSGRVIKVGNEIFEGIIDPNIFNTGDELTDKLLKDSIKFFKETDRANRTLALEKLWDSWERIKTLEDSDKKNGVEKLLTKGIANAELRQYIEIEAKTLTDIGNRFQIRHFEKDKIRLNDEDVDYLYYRLFNLVLRLLMGTNRITHD